MKKKYSSRLMTVIMCIIIVILMSACGKKPASDPDNKNESLSEDNSRPDGDSNDVDDGADVVVGDDRGDYNNNDVSHTDDSDSPDGTDDDPTPDKNKDISVSIYKVGTDIIAFNLKGSVCAGIMGRMGEYGYIEDSDRIIVIDDGTWETENQSQFQVQLKSTGVTLFYTDAVGERKQAIAFSHYEVEPVTGEDYYFGLIYMDGICGKIRPQNKMTVIMIDNASGTSEELGVIDGTEAVKDISLEEFADIAGAAYTHRKALMCDWAGTWVADEYSNVSGKAVIRITENGGILVDCKVGDENRTFAAAEGIREDYSENRYSVDLLLLNLDHESEHTPYFLELSFHTTTKMPVIRIRKP